ncbi:MAG: diacylglycerol kinase family protein, partial [Agromyces sp.]
MHVVVAINPTSAFGRHGDVGREVVARLERAGHQVIALEEATFAALEHAVEDAVERGIDALVVVGGDGMVSLGVNAVAERRVPLGIVAAGTGNDMARGLGLVYSHPLAAVDELISLMQREPREIDLARVTAADGSTRWFGCVLSAGFDAIVNERANRMRWPKGPSRYILALLLELSRLRTRSYQLEIDGHSRAVDAVLIAVGNNTSLGGGMQITPNARLDDGQLDLVMGARMGRLKLLTLFPKVFSGAHIGHPLVTEIRGTHFRIDTPDVIAYADGERL